MLHNVHQLEELQRVSIKLVQVMSTQSRRCPRAFSQRGHIAAAVSCCLLEFTFEKDGNSQKDVLSIKGSWRQSYLEGFGDGLPHPLHQFQGHLPLQRVGGGGRGRLRWLLTYALWTGDLHVRKADCCRL